VDDGPLRRAVESCPARPPLHREQGLFTPPEALAYNRRSTGGSVLTRAGHQFSFSLPRRRRNLLNLPCRPQANGLTRTQPNSFSSSLCHANRFSVQGEQLSRRMCHVGTGCPMPGGVPANETAATPMQQRRIPLTQNLAGGRIPSGQGSDWVRSQPFDDLCWLATELRKRICDMSANRS
jgi:hypothetical protein